MVIIDQEKCIQCELCAKDCVQKNIKNRKGQMTVIGECIECGHCLAICPQNAVTIEGYDMDQVFDLDPTKSLNADDLLYAIKTRRSIRQFKEIPLSKDQVSKLCQAIRYTATAENRQDEEVVFVLDKMQEFENIVYGTLEEIFEGKDPREMDSDWAGIYLFTMRHRRNPSDDFLLRKAPAAIIIASDHPWDAGLQSQNVENLANAMGLGVLYNGYMSRLIDEMEAVKEWLGLSGKHISSMMLVGQPAVKYQRTAPRKELNVRMM